jgi:hypothetical protein
MVYACNAENKFRVGKLFPESVFRVLNPCDGSQVSFCPITPLSTTYPPEDLFDGPGMFIAMKFPTF